MQNHRSTNPGGRESLMPYDLLFEVSYLAFECHIYWKGDQLLVEKLKNPLWVISSYFDTRVLKPNEQPFLHFIIFPPRFCSYLSLLTFSYVLFFLGCCHFISTTCDRNTRQENICYKETQLIFCGNIDTFMLICTYRVEETQFVVSQTKIREQMAYLL